jgi:AraC family transcriptional regulator
MWAMRTGSDRHREPWVISSQSLRCRSAIPSARCRSSRDVGWTSLLVDVHAGSSSTEPYTSVGTNDPRLGVTISGRYSAEYFTQGRWRHDSHGPGSINLHRTGEVTRYRFPPPEDPDYEFALIYLPLEEMRSAADHLRRPGQRSEVPAFADFVDRDPAITHTTLALVRAMAAGERNIYAEAAAAWLAVHLLHCYGANAGAPEDRDPGVLTDRRLSRVVEFMSGHFGEPLTLDRLAEEACISRYHFARLFKAKVGQSPHRYLAALRLGAAKRMLETTDRSVADVGAACGYPASSHFTAAFTARYGASPRALRAAARGGIGAPSRAAEHQ